MTDKIKPARLRRIMAEPGDDGHVATYDDDGTAPLDPWYRQHGWLDPTAAEALRTELSTTRQERDRARDGRTGLAEQLAHADAGAVELSREIVRLRAMLPVVEAAKAWREGFDSFAITPHQFSRLAKTLIAAVDALSTPPPGEGE